MDVPPETVAVERKEKHKHKESKSGKKSKKEHKHKHHKEKKGKKEKKESKDVAGAEEEVAVKLDDHSGPESGEIERQESGQIAIEGPVQPEPEPARAAKHSRKEEVRAVQHEEEVERWAGS